MMDQAHSCGPGRGRVCRLSRVAGLAAMLLYSYYAAAETPITKATVRFVEYADPGDRWRETKAYIAGEWRNVLLAPETTDPFYVGVREDGNIVLDVKKMLPPVAPDSLGLRIRMRYAPSDVLGKEFKRIGYHFLPQSEAGVETLTLRPPGQPTHGAEVYARQVLPVHQCITSPPVEIPNGAQLDFALGLQQDWRIDSRAGARFRIALAGESRWQIVFDEVVHRYGLLEEPQWRTRRLDLSEHAGETAQFAFITEPVRGAPEPCHGFPLWGTPVLEGEAAAEAEKPNVLLICLDTLRPDHLGCYGYERETSPELDKYAEKCVLFEQAVSAAAWTTPSHASIFTGLWPTTHKAGYLSLGFDLSEDWTTIAELARRAGYRTGAITEGLAIAGGNGFSQGFDSYYDGPPDTTIGNGLAEHTFERAENWLKDYKNTPFFFFLHTYEIHLPYNAPMPWRTLFAPSERRGLPADAEGLAETPAEKQHLLDCYDGGIAYTDAYLGDFLDEVERMDIPENTVIIIFSDHGEAFWEHGDHGHTQNVYDETIRVLLMLRMPGEDAPTGRVKQQVCSMDLFGTLVELLDLKPDLDMQTYSLLPLVDPKAWPGGYGRKKLVSELINWDEDLSNEMGVLNEWVLRAVRTEEEKYIRSNKEWVRSLTRARKEVAEGGDPEYEEEFFHLAEDQGEKEDISADAPERTAAFRKYLLDFLERFANAYAEKQPGYEPSQGAMETLRALGYL